MMVCLVVMRRKSPCSPVSLRLATLASQWYIYLMTIRHVWVTSLLCVLGGAGVQDGDGAV